MIMYMISYVYIHIQAEHILSAFTAFAMNKNLDAFFMMYDIAETEVVCMHTDTTYLHVNIKTHTHALL